MRIFELRIFNHRGYTGGFYRYVFKVSQHMQQGNPWPLKKVGWGLILSPVGKSETFSSLPDTLVQTLQHQISAALSPPSRPSLAPIIHLKPLAFHLMGVQVEEQKHSKVERESRH